MYVVNMDDNIDLEKAAKMLYAEVLRLRKIIAKQNKIIKNYSTIKKPKIESMKWRRIDGRLTRYENLL